MSRSTALGIIAWPLALLCAAPVGAGTFNVVHDFQGGADGGNPAAPLSVIRGRVYGTTLYGGSNGGFGTVYDIAAGGKHNVLYSFSDLSDGGDPFSTLTEVGGLVYGTTSSGGANSQGTLFSIAPDGTETVVYSFTGPDDGRFPLSGLVAMDGVLYGATAAGGDGSCNGGSGCGVVYSFTPATGAFKTVYRLSNDSGWFVSANLLAVAGRLYGVAPSGGKNGEGTVFSVTTAGKLTVLHSFTGADGSAPSGALTLVDKVLYGTASGGGSYGEGVAFSLTLAGTETVLHSFGSGTDGNVPESNLTYLNGRLYGTTNGGGTESGGTVFSIGLAGDEVVEHSLGHTDGIFPQDGLVEKQGVLYGNTYDGGGNGCGGYGCGTVFFYIP